MTQPSRIRYSDESRQFLKPLVSLLYAQAGLDSLSHETILSDNTRNFVTPSGKNWQIIVVGGLRANRYKPAQDYAVPPKLRLPKMPRLNSVVGKISISENFAARPGDRANVRFTLF